MCPPTNTYDWGIRGHGLTGEGPEGDQITGWWTAQWLSCGASTPNTIIEIRNFRTLGWTGSQWVTFAGNWNQWCGTFNSTTTGPAGSCTFVGAGVRMPTGQLALHGASWRVDDQNVQCVTTVYEARSNVAVMMNAGADHISGGNINGDLFISKLKRIGTGWTPIGGSSCLASRLRSNPPPGF